MQKPEHIVHDQRPDRTEKANKFRLLVISGWPPWRERFELWRRIGGRRQWLCSQSRRRNGRSWILNDPSSGKRMGYRTEQPPSLARWKQREEVEPGAKMFPLKFQGCGGPTVYSASIFSSCAHLTHAWKEQQQLFNLEHLLSNRGIYG